MGFEMPMRFFTEHPQSVGETYTEHMGQSLFFARNLSLAAAASLIHAFLPFCFTRSASARVTMLHDRMVANRHKGMVASRPSVEPDAIAAE